MKRFVNLKLQQNFTPPPLSRRGGDELARQFLDAFFLEEKYYDAIK